MAAAIAEFADRGFAGAGVDRIAKRAGANKALIYYYFASKQNLYRDIVRQGLATLVAAARAAVAGARTPPQKLDAYIEALILAHERQPGLTPLLLRELAEGGRQLDRDALQLMVDLFRVIREILESGQAEGSFRQADPLLTHFMLIGSALLYSANAPLRKRIRELHMPGGPSSVPVDATPFVSYLQGLLRQALLEKPS